MLEEKRRIEDTGFTTADAGTQDLVGTVMTQVFATLLWENKFTSMSSRESLEKVTMLYPLAWPNCWQPWHCSAVFVPFSSLSLTVFILPSLCLGIKRKNNKQKTNQDCICAITPWNDNNKKAGESSILTSPAGIWFYPFSERLRWPRTHLPFSSTDVSLFAVFLALFSVLMFPHVVDFVLFLRKNPWLRKQGQEHKSLPITALFSFPHKEQLMPSLILSKRLSGGVILCHWSCC